jgi:DNA-binding response OmpR family regulator
VKVLVVDGDARIRARLAERLALARAEVLEATTLADAVDRVELTAIEAALLDIHVDAHTPHPGVVGLARLRAVVPGALIVVLTNEAGEVHRRECLRHGADAFFDKSAEFDGAVELVLRRMTRTS